MYAAMMTAARSLSDTVVVMSWEEWSTLDEEYFRSRYPKHQLFQVENYLGLGGRMWWTRDAYVDYHETCEQIQKEIDDKVWYSFGGEEPDEKHSGNSK